MGGPGSADLRFSGHMFEVAVVLLKVLARGQLRIQRPGSRAQLYGVFLAHGFHVSIAGVPAVFRALEML